MGHSRAKRVGKLNAAPGTESQQERNAGRSLGIHPWRHGRESLERRGTLNPLQEEAKQRGAGTGRCSLPCSVLQGSDSLLLATGRPSCPLLLLVCKPWPSQDEVPIVPPTLQSSRAVQGGEGAMTHSPSR